MSNGAKGPIEQANSGLAPDTAGQSPARSASARRTPSEAGTPDAPPPPHRDEPPPEPDLDAPGARAIGHGNKAGGRHTGNDPEKQAKRKRRQERRALRQAQAAAASDAAGTAHDIQSAAPARMRPRHWGLITSFVVLVLAPFAVVTWYLWFVALDQYASVTGFTVRQEEGTNASQLIGGLAQLTGGQTGTDGEILYEFILSQSLVRNVEQSIGLSDHYGARWDADPVFGLRPDPSIEDLEAYWKRVVRVAYDPNTGLTELRVLAFTPEKAQEVATEVLRQSQDMLNALNEQAREDAMRYALADLDEAVERLKVAREALTAFRTRTQIVDPAADIQGRMGVMNNLQQQLAQAFIEYDLIRETTAASDPRVTQAARRIEVIQERIVDERESFASRSPVGAALDDYPSLIAEFEGLVVDREFAEETYRAALAALDAARAQAQRQSRYLATYVQPNLAEDSVSPARATLTAITGLILLLSWAVMALIYYSIRDRA
jgi:capsular polysaccharide transport system permease protein